MIAYAGMILQSENLLLDDVGRCLVFVQSRANLNDGEHQEIGHLYRRIGGALPEYRLLVLTDGAGPTSKQRRELNAEFGSALKNVRTAIVSDAVTVRFIGSMVGLFAPQVRSFAVHQTTQALRYLDLDDRIIARLSRAVREVPQGRFSALDAGLRPLVVASS